MPRPDDGAGLLPVPLLAGIREDVRQLAPIGSLGRAENVRFSVDKITQRPGTNLVLPTTAGSVHEITNANSDPIGLLSRVGNVPLLGVNGELFAQDEVSSTFQFAGIYSTCVPVQKRSPFPAGPSRSFGNTRSGVAVNSQGYVLSFANTNGLIFWQLESPEGVRLYYGSESATKAAVVVQGATFLLITQQGAPAINLIAIPVTISSGVVSTGTRTNVGVLTAAAAYWDASSYDANNWLIIYQSAAALVTMRLYNQVTTSGPKTSSFAVTGTVPVSIWGDVPNGRAWIGWYDNLLDVRYSGWDISAATWVAYKASTVIYSLATNAGPPLFGPGETGTGPLFIVSQAAVAAAPPTARSSVYGWLDTSGAVEASTYTVYHVTPISKPDSLGRAWCITGNESTNWRFQRVVLLKFRHKTLPASATPPANQPTIELALDDGLAPLNLANIPSRQYDYFHAVAEGSSAHFFVSPSVLQQGPGSNETISVDLTKYVPSSLQPARRADEYGIWTTVSGQPVQVFGFAAGQYAAGSTPAPTEHEFVGAIEIGFAYRTAVLSALQVAAGSLTALGVYSWVFCFEWTDPLGQRHRSAPSVPYSLTLTGGNQQVTFTLVDLDWHQKTLRDAYFDPAIVAYRTVNAGTTWFRETVATGSALSSRGTAGIITYTSGSSASQTDALISASEVLYTDGGVLANALAPACSFTCRTEERMVCGGLLDPRIIQFSKILVPGEPIQFADSDAFRVLLPEACTALAYQDGILYAFAKGAIYAISGDGPNDQGIGSFSTPRAVGRDLGAVDFRSIVETAVGVFFMSDRGLHLLPRGGGTPQFVGAGIETTTASFPYCLGAIRYSDSDTRTVRFLLSSTRYVGLGGQQRVLVYDLEMSALQGYPVWSMDRYARGLQACGVWSSPVFGLTSLANYCAYKEAPGTADELNVAPVAFTALVETNPIRPWGAIGWGEMDTVTALTSATSGSPTCGMSVYQDGALLESVSWTPTTNTEESYWQMRPSKRHCTAFRVQCTTSSSSGAGYATWHALQVAHESLGERLTTSAERVT